MEFELEVFEVHDEGDQAESVSLSSSKKHLKHTRKKCKHKSSIVNISGADSELQRSKTSVVSTDCQRRPQGLRESIISVFSKLVVWRDQRRYQTTVPDKIDSPHSSKEYYKTYPGESTRILPECSPGHCTTTPNSVFVSESQRRIRANDRQFNAQFKYAVSINGKNDFTMPS